MEEFEQSVNTGEVAETQTEQVTNQQVQDASANTSEVADQNTVQDANTNAQYADMRRKQELDEYRSKAETYQQNLDRVAKVAGYESHDQMLAELDRIEKEQERAQYEQAGIDPDTFNSLLEKHPDIQYAREMKQKQEEEAKFQEQANELFQEFPNLKPDDIQPEVWQLQANKGLSLLDAYLRVNYKNMGQQAEQQAIQKLTTNQATSTGSLSGGDPSHNTSISSMSKDDFAKLQERVLRGEKVQL